MTPLSIIIMLNCYASYDPGQNVHPHIWNSPAAQEVRDELVQAGLLDQNTLRPTERGERYVRTLCDLNPQEQK